MKLYKTAVTYTIICITDRKLDKEIIERLQHNIDINIGRHDMIRTEGKIETISKEFSA